MAVVRRDLGLLFILDPATGSTAIGDLLCERYERLQEDCDAAIHRLGGTTAEIPRVDLSTTRAPRPYRFEYDLLSRALVRIGQREGLEGFGYSF